MSFQETEYIVEQKTSKILTAMGWDVCLSPRIIRDNGTVFYPDLSLGYRGKQYGYVEIKAKLFSHDDREKIAAKIIGNLKPDVFIFTNGYVFDLFIFGEYVATYSIPPTPEEVEMLLEDKEQ